MTVEREAGSRRGQPMTFMTLNRRLPVMEMWITPDPHRHRIGRRHQQRDRLFTDGCVQYEFLSEVPSALAVWLLASDRMPPPQSTHAQ